MAQKNHDRLPESPEDRSACPAASLLCLPRMCFRVHSPPLGLKHHLRTDLLVKSLWLAAQLPFADPGSYQLYSFCPCIFQKETLSGCYALSSVHFRTRLEPMPFVSLPYVGFYHQHHPWPTFSLSLFIACSSSH